MSDALLRKLALLKSVPVYPRKVSTRQVLESLECIGFVVTIRTVQRDLEQLSGSGMFGIGVDKRSKPAGWFWLKDSKNILLPHMDIPTAIAYQFIANSAHQLLPHSVIEHLSPFLDQADQLLKNRSEWNNKVVWERGGDSCGPASRSIEPATRDVVYEALDKGRCFAAEYGRYFNDAKLTYLRYDCVHPLGIFLSENTTYLVAKLGEVSAKIYYLPVYRLRKAVLTKHNVDCPDGFNLQRYVDEHPFSERYKENIELELWVKPIIISYLIENPIDENQTANRVSEHWYSVNVVTDDTSTLRTLIQSFGDSVIVKKPKMLRKLVQDRLEKAVFQYKTE